LLEILVPFAFSFFVKMNENLIECFSRHRRADASNKDHTSMLREKLNVKVQEYYHPAQKPLGAGLWLDRPELPTSAEVMDMDDDSATSDVVEIAPNNIEGPWESKGESWPKLPHTCCIR
jgi:helicase required for RNAi-mediated heterochromatin assembly 1